MLIHIRLFAILRDRAGTDRLELEVADGASVRVAAEELATRLPALAGFMDRVAFAVNLSYVSLDHVLTTNDELAVIPAVSGGVDRPR